MRSSGGNFARVSAAIRVNSLMNCSSVIRFLRPFGFVGTVAALLSMVTV
jgi:hypothetical protein